MQPEAALPPPFPSGAPLRLYISNMAVAPAARRRGVARRLLAGAVRTAGLWAEPSVWLHVGSANAGARQLYAAAGFGPARGSLSTRLSNVVPGPWSQSLMALPLGEGAGGWLRRWAAALRRREQEEGAAATAVAEGSHSAGDGSSSSSSGGGSSSGGSSGSSGGGGSGAFQWPRLVAEEQQAPRA
jgi:uncharacterized membrane protein YgcG